MSAHFPRNMFPSCVCVLLLPCTAVDSQVIHYVRISEMPAHISPGLTVSSILVCVFIYFN